MNKNILHITSSPRGKNSSSTLLGNTIVEKLLQEFPGSRVSVNNVLEKNYQPLGQLQVEAFRMRDDERSPAHRSAMSDSDTAVNELLDSDIMVISVPLYNFGVPAALKSWVDHVVRAGRTFTYESGYPEGLLRGRKLYLAIASDGVYSDGPLKSMDHAEPYLRSVFGFLGVADIVTHRIEGMAIPGIMETAVQKGLESVVR